MELLNSPLVVFAVGLLPTLTTGTVLFYWQRRQKKHDEAVNARAEARKRESLLSLDLQIANAKLSYAVARAVQRGEPNGEIEEGIEAYVHAKEQWETFAREQMTERIFENRD